MGRAPTKYGFYEADVWVPTGSLMLPVERLITADWNPNSQSAEVFQALVESIKTDGFLEALQVAPITPAMRATYLDARHDDGDYWLIVGGAHRKDAGVLLGMAALPVVVKEDWDEDMAKLRNMRLNMLKGRVNGAKFAALFGELRAKGYAEDALKAQMGLVEQSALKNLMRHVADNVPPAMKQALAAATDTVRNQDDLARVLNELFSKHGDTLPYGYMVFDFAGKTNYWVPMSKATKGVMDETAQACLAQKLDFNRVLTNLLGDADAMAAATQRALDQAAAEDAALFA